MHCARCGHKFGRADHFCMFYARRTDGQKQDFCLCAKCTTEFGDFMKAGMPAEKTETDATDVADTLVN